VLTSSKDWNAIIWDLASDTDPPKRVTTIRFDVPIVTAYFHPRNSQIVLALLSSGEAYIVDLRKEHRGRYELCEPEDDDGNEEEPSSSRGPQSNVAVTVARFDPTGRYVFLGTSSGTILVFNSRTKTMIARHKLSSTGTLKGLTFTQSGRRIVTNSSDRTLRQFNIPNYAFHLQSQSFLESELEPTFRFSDPINKVAWHTMAYSPDGEFLAGGAADNATHKIYVWDSVNEGQFVSMLDGGREPLLFLDWHPTKPAIASTTNMGNILLWHCPTPEKWGAFAGGFEEGDENVLYEEREDEFDIEDSQTILQRTHLAQDQPVDIVTLPDPENEPQPFHITHFKPSPTKNLVNGHGNVNNGDVNGMAILVDEDFAWADEDPDDDVEGWKMKVLMEEDEGDG